MIPLLILGVGTAVLFAIKHTPKAGDRWHKETRWRE